MRIQMTTATVVHMWAAPAKIKALTNPGLET